MLNKLKAEYDLEQSYYRLGFFSNSLLLNKKMYLLYNMFNKKKIFFLLKKKEREVGSYTVNFLGFDSLSTNFYKEKNKKNDYFFK